MVKNEGITTAENFHWLFILTLASFYILVNTEINKVQMTVSGEAKFTLAKFFLIEPVMVELRVSWIFDH